jgi:hypothetical protein
MGLPVGVTAMVIKRHNWRAAAMNEKYQQRDLKDLYRAKDVMFTVVGIVCAFAGAIWFARFFTGWAGI